MKGHLSKTIELAEFNQAPSLEYFMARRYPPTFVNTWQLGPSILAPTDTSSDRLVNVFDSPRPTPLVDLSRELEYQPFEGPFVTLAELYPHVWRYRALPYRMGRFQADTYNIVGCLYRPHPTNSEGAFNLDPSQFAFNFRQDTFLQFLLDPVDEAKIYPLHAHSFRLYKKISLPADLAPPHSSLYECLDSVVDVKLIEYFS
jgi:hypothetical protein